MPTIKILAFAGSSRKESYNKKLVKIAAEGARARGAEVMFIDLADLSMPIYDEDLEKRDGMPPNARKFKDLLIAHHGFLISSPEYNSSISALLKNCIDWATRPQVGVTEPPLVAFSGKVAALMSASPGALGGLRGLVTLRMILGNIHTVVIPDQVAIVKAHESFNADGTLKDEKQRASVGALGQKVVTLAAKLHG